MDGTKGSTSAGTYHTTVSGARWEGLKWEKSKPKPDHLQNWGRTLDPKERLKGLQTVLVLVKFFHIKQSSNPRLNRKRCKAILSNGKNSHRKLQRHL